MSIKNDLNKVQIWHRLVAQTRKDAKLFNQLIHNPGLVLENEGLITHDQTVIIKTRDADDQAYDVLVYPSTSTSDEPEVLVLPTGDEVRGYFQKLPSQPGTIIAGPGCGIPGGCSGSF